jgi:uncharacterized protein YbjQ (UPF0145 family)
MVKKKADESNDLTRIEDLSEFLHSEDSDMDSLFENLSSSEPESEKTQVSELDLTSDEPIVFESIEETPEEEITFETSSLDEVSFETLPDTDLGFMSTEIEEDQEEATVLEDFSEIEEEAEEKEEDSYSYTDETPTQEIYTNTSEKFEDVKTFAQNFSYGKTSLKGGNPPYTIIARHIKYQDDADDIINLLTEFGLINDQNMNDTQRAIEMGSLIIPQISEYTAIVIAHKLRRFDLDLEVGLSDEIHPSKSGEVNPKGLLKKENLKQNRTESLNLKELSTSIKDIIVATTASIPGYFVEEYIGVQTVFSIFEEAELEKLQYVEKSQREKSELFDYNSSDLSTERAFQEYQNSFALLYDDLANQLKQKAFKQNANALLGLTFQLSPLQFERSHTRVNAYQITCSATLAIVGKENS